MQLIPEQKQSRLCCHNFSYNGSFKGYNLSNKFLFQYFFAIKSVLLYGMTQYVIVQYFNEFIGFGLPIVKAIYFDSYFLTKIQF